MTKCPTWRLSVFLLFPQITESTTGLNTPVRFSLLMPTHSVELDTRELILLMELTSEAIDDGRYPYAEEHTLRRMHEKAERALGFEPPSQPIEEEGSRDRANRDPDGEEPSDSEIFYRGPSLTDLLEDSDDSEKFL